MEEDKFGSAERLLDRTIESMKRNPQKTIFVGIFIAVLIFAGGYLYSWGANLAPKSAEKFAQTILSIGTNYGPIKIATDDKTNEQPSLPKEDVFFTKGDNYSGPKLKLLLAETLSTTTTNNYFYHAKLSLVIGVAPGSVEPILNNIISPPGLNCVYDNIRREPAVAVGGELIGRVIYTYEMICASKKPFTSDSFKNFTFNYSY